MAARDTLYKLCYDDPKGAVELVEKLKRTPAELYSLITFRDPFGATPLHIVSEKGHHHAVEILLEAGADKDASTKGGWTPLLSASVSGHHQVVQVLLASGADKHSADNDGATPLYIASQHGHHQVVKLLVATGVERSVGENDGWQPLHVASKNGHHQVVEVLLSAGANKNAMTKGCWTPLHIASLKGHCRVVQVLLSAGVDKMAATKDGRTPLYTAVHEEHHQVVKKLLAAGVDRDAPDQDGWTSLHLASKKGCQQLVETLLAAGAVQNPTKDGKTPLWIASQHGHHQVAEVLLTAGADKNAVDSNRWTPLHIASVKGYHRVVDVLLAAGANKDAPDVDWWTPLHVASQEGQPQVVEMLLAAGADKSACDEDGRTPLYIASQNGHHHVVRHLLSVAADKLKKYHGKTPIDIARKRGHPDVVTILSSPTRPPLSPLLAASLTSLNRVKLMVMGRAAVGKTTLVRALFGEQLDASIPSTDGIDLGQFSAGGIDFMTWDFGGQKVYRYTHQLFLSGHAVYLVLFKASDPVTESLKEVRFWLNSISARISDSVVLLVGTHADKLDAKVSKSRVGELSKAVVREYPSLFDGDQRAHVISAHAVEHPAFNDLLNTIVQAGQSVDFPAPKNFASALHFLTGLQLSPPVIELRTAISSLQAIPSVDKSELQTFKLLKAFHTLGFISVFHNEELPSRGVIVLRPQWIARLLATIVTTRHTFVNKESGVLSHSALVNHLWTDHAEFPPERHRDLIELLIQLDIFFPLCQGEEYFVPCMLREETPDVEFYLPIQLSEAALQLHRVMELECTVPISVIPPIMVELMGFGELRARWQQGCVVRIPASQPGMNDQVWLQVWRSGGRTIELKVWGESVQTVTQWLRRVYSQIDARLKEFYHVNYKTLIPCRDCFSSSLDGHFSLVELRNHVLQSHSEATCLPHGLHHCRLDTMVPDWLFLDLRSRGFVVPFESLTEIRELGQGAYGKVLMMSMTVPVSVDEITISPAPTCSSCPMVQSASSSSFTPTPPPAVDSHCVVAVKFLGELKGKVNETAGNFIEEFKHEVYLMSSLDDPNVVKLSGICLKPKLAMVMEVVGGGDLYGQLNDPFRLRSRVYDFVKLLNAAFSDFTLNATFRNVFLNRFKLAPDDQQQLEIRIAGLLTEPRDDAIGWIQEQFDQHLGDVEFNRLTQSKPVADLGLSAEQLKRLGLPKPPVLATLGNMALEKAQRAFHEWKESADVRGVSGLTEAIENWEQRFFAAVEHLFRMQVDRASYNEFKRVNEQMKEIEDGIETLSREHAWVVAPVAEALRLKLAIDIARGMVHLHELNPPIVHRDLKTPNVFLTRSLVNFPSLEDDDESWRTSLAKVGDFGLSLLSLQSHSFQIRDREQDDPLNNLNATWAAPELLNSGRYSTPVDVYSMGIILWELLFRQHPFLELHREAVRSEVIAGRRPAVPAVIPEDPNLQEYIHLMTRCWNQNPTKRPSMRQVYDSLRDICQTRCPKLFSKLLPSPTPRASLILRGHDIHEHETAPIVSSHLFVSPAGSAVTMPRVACMLAPFQEQEVLWLGLESGHVAMVDYRHGDPQREMLRWIECCEWDKHKQRVTAISCLCRNSDEEGAIWTGSEDGGIHVWSPHLRSLEEIFDANTLKGRLEFLTQFLFIDKVTPCWVECELGTLSWFANRHDLKPIKSLPVASIRSVYTPDPHSLSVVDSAGKTYSFRQPEEDQGGCGVTEWHRVLNNIINTSTSRSRGITRLAGQRQSMHGILALEGVDHTVWSANAGFLLTEWGLDNTVDHHGLHRTMQLRPLRSMQLTASKLETARLRTIGGFVRVAASTLWVAVGDRWVVLDLVAGAATWQEAMVPGMDRIAAVLSVQNKERKGQELWTIDCEGRRVVWRCNDAVNPQVAGELVDEEWREEDGRGYCMVQVGNRQVWVGTSQGRVLSWDAPSRHLVRPELQPLSASHPLAHGRSVHALVSIPGAQPPIVWSASRDQTLRRFSW